MLEVSIAAKPSLAAHAIPGRLHHLLCQHLQAIKKPGSAPNVFAALEAK